MIGFLTTRAFVELFGRGSEKEDIIPVEFTHTELVSFTLKKTDSAYRFIQKSQVFAVNIPHRNTDKEEYLCETHEGLVEDKFVLTGFKKAECNTIDCPAIKDMTVLECSYVKEEQKENRITVFGRVVTTKEA
jgi:flavin reductase (DIM6/NTAB) family NADH-FMN oxidoreductase RutF